MSVKEFQQKRIDAFDKIDEQLKMIRLLLVDAKNKTIKHYQQYPNIHSVLYSTDMIKGMLTEIEELLTEEDD